jgi:phage terminase large subunit-like protein
MAIYRRPAIHKGKSIFPERWTLDELEMIARQDPVFFQANYMLAPAEGGATTFQLDWLHNYEWDGPRKHITFRDQRGFRKVIRVTDLTTFISCDPAFSDNIKSARTAIPVVGTDGEHFFILEDFAERGLGPQDIANKIAEFAQRYKPHTIFLETIVAQKALVEPIKRALKDSHVHPEPLLDEISSHGKRSKELRIYGLEPWFKGGQFYYHPSQVNFREEYSTFPRGAQRDLLDALAFQVERGWERTGAGSTKNATGAAAEFNKRTLDKLRKSTGIHGGY